MRITLEGCRLAPSWVDVERFVCSALACPGGKLTRISRMDGGADYRAHGTYRLTFDPRDGDKDERIVLDVR